MSTPTGSAEPAVTIDRGLPRATLRRVTVVTDRWGVADYARLNATLSMPLLVTAAFTSLAAAAVFVVPRHSPVPSLASGLVR